MGSSTAISYADHTFNPWIGCTKVSAGCANCYAEHSPPARIYRVAWGPGQQRRMTKDWSGPVKWDAAAERDGIRRRVMVSLCDWLDPEVNAEWLWSFLGLVRDTPWIDWLLTTKRPELFEERLSAVLDVRSGGSHDWVRGWLNGWPTPRNVWVGVSIDNEEVADRRLRGLLEIPAEINWISFEPLLGPVDLLRCLATRLGRPLGNDALYAAIRKTLDWVVVGGESGRNARPCNVEWIRGIVKQCQSAAVPVYVKQLGSCPEMMAPDATGQLFRLLRRLKHPKGGDPSEWPEDLRLRQWRKE